MGRFSSTFPLISLFICTLSFLMSLSALLYDGTHLDKIHKYETTSSKTSFEGEDACVIERGNNHKDGHIYLEIWKCDNELKGIHRIQLPIERDDDDKPTDETRYLYEYSKTTEVESRYPYAIVALSAMQSVVVVFVFMKDTKFLRFLRMYAVLDKLFLVVCIVLVSYIGETFHHKGAEIMCAGDIAKFENNDENDVAYVIHNSENVFADAINGLLMIFAYFLVFVILVAFGVSLIIMAISMLRREPLDEIPREGIPFYAIHYDTDADARLVWYFLPTIYFFIVVLILAAIGFGTVVYFMLIQTPRRLLFVIPQIIEAIAVGLVGYY